MAKNHSKKLRYISLIPIVIIVAFFTWLMIRVATMNAEIQIVTDYVLPEGNSLDDVADVGYGSGAVAIDGLVVGVESDAEPIIRPTASTAKMITALAVMRAKPFNPGETGETLTIGQDDYNKYVWYYTHNGSNTRVQVGEMISQYDALASMLMASSNNMADSLAIWAFGSLDNYREYATSMLAELGISHTTIGPDASGYDASTTSTAEDLAKIGHLLMKEPVLKEIVGTKYHDVPVAGKLTNTNGLLGIDNISGIKTGYIGDASGYCLIAGYNAGEHLVTSALLGAPTRSASFDDSLAIIRKVQSLAPVEKLVNEGDVVGHYEMWWGKNVPIRAIDSLDGLNWKTQEKSANISMQGDAGKLAVKIGNWTGGIAVKPDDYQRKPSLWDKIRHAFGWSYSESDSSNSVDCSADSEKRGVECGSTENGTQNDSSEEQEDSNDTSAEKTPEEILAEENASLAPITAVPSDNYTIGFGYLMLINPNFTVDTRFIDARKAELVSISSLYGIVEGNPYNGDNLLDPEAAAHIHEMVEAYKAEYPGHTLETRSCYRARGTTCGRLCAATGASDHHTGLTCDLLDPAYGTSLDTDTYPQHIDWQWLKANSYKYGFIDRFPEAWAGGPMSAPLNVDENGSTGLYETWHYRYVGVGPATEIATGKYNNGEYDSLEHYLKMRGLIKDLKNNH